MSHLAKLAVTPGEPAGIGPDLCIQHAQVTHDYQMIMLVDPELIEQRSKELGLSVNLIEYDSSMTTASGSGNLYYQSSQLRTPVQSGKLDPRNSPYVLETLDNAIQGCLNGSYDALLTGPVHKGIINEAGIAFTGHTEYLAQKTQTRKVVMMLASSEMKVALATTHLPLRDVPDAITTDSLNKIIEIIHDDLKNRFGLNDPHIMVCGLNPHAGEDGHLGMEEIEIIEPVIRQFQNSGHQISGPHPADTLFARHNLKQADAVLAMYHDQGLPVLKHNGFGKATNITLGLPMIRTSVDHGTALSLAGKGQASTGSLEYSIDMTLQMIHSSNKPLTNS